MTVLLFWLYLMRIIWIVITGCFVFQVSEIPAASSTVSSPTVMDTDYKTFDCSFSIDLPAVTGAYSYDVKVFPGDVTETAGNTINIGKFTLSKRLYLKQMYP